MPQFTADFGISEMKVRIKRIMFDNEGHWIDDPLEVVNVKPDFSGMGLEPIKTKEKELWKKDL